MQQCWTILLESAQTLDVDAEGLRFGSAGSNLLLLNLGDLFLKSCTALAHAELSQRSPVALNIAAQGHGV